jgi:hypothetical protein
MEDDKGSRMKARVRGVQEKHAYKCARTFEQNIWYLSLYDMNDRGDGDIYDFSA